MLRVYICMFNFNVYVYVTVNVRKENLKSSNNVNKWHVNYFGL